jgi:hypothetical protein
MISWGGGRSFALLLLALSSLGIGTSRLSAQTQGFVLEIEMANPSGGWAQLYYDIGQWYSGTDSVRVETPASATLKFYRFPIPAKPVKRLRFDPADGAATLRFGRMRLVTAEGKTLASFGPEALIPMNGIESLTVAEGVATVKTKPDDPMVSIARPLQAETTAALGRSVVSEGQLWALGLVTAALMVFGLFVATRSVVVGAAPGRPRAVVGWVLLGAFLVVFGARLYWLKLYSRPMPFWDEWETDAVCLLIPLKGHFLDWEALFIPQGEHRIVITRLLNVLGTLLNGEWDPRLGMVAGAAFYAGGVALVAGAMARFLTRWQLVVLPLLLGWACLPFDWRNLYWGDQTQMYLLNLMAIGVLVIACAETVTGVVIAGALAAAFTSLFTMGSGLVAPGIAAGICLWRVWREPGQRRALAGLAGAFLAMAVVGLLLYRKAPYQGPDYVQHLAQLWSPLLNRTSWPFPPQLFKAAIVWLPWVALLGLIGFRRVNSRIALLAAGLGGWALINAGGLAHGRPHDLPPFDTKYYTSMSVAVSAAVLCAAVIVALRPSRKILGTLALVSAACAGVTLFQVGQRSIQGARDQQTERGWNDDVVRPFLASGDPTQLRATHFSRLPYWNGAELADILESKQLQPLLPAVLRTALAQRPNSPLRGPQEPGWLTMGARGLMKAGPVLLTFGVLAIFAGWWVLWREAPKRVEARGE